MTKLTQLVWIGAACTVLSWAQVNRGTITGVVSDPSGAVAPA